MTVRGEKEKSYCVKCGAEEVNERVWDYSRTTGEPRYWAVCPTNPCGHSGHYCEPIKLSFWEDLIGLPDSKCKRCGAKFHSCPF